ncbi:MAG: LppP/LprE family lipoprotein [Chloroflexi bacterium]|nr:LppP/LprE family lipoprotein [Chloroflexota bacterium]
MYVLAALLMLLPLFEQTSIWLDLPLSNWNTPGAAVPAAEPAPSTLPMCSNEERAPANPAESQLAPQGWKLETYWSPIGGSSQQVILATSGYDGMCRPLAFNAFVFSNGRFAGTLSPNPMLSREDGVLTGTPSVLPDGTMQAEFIRYAPTDPLCCPSGGRTPVVYALESVSGAPVVVPVQITSAEVISAPAQVP